MISGGPSSIREVVECKIITGNRPINMGLVRHNYNVRQNYIS